MQLAHWRHENAEAEQTLQLAYSFPLINTRDVFAPDNPALLQALCRREPDKRQRLAIFLDSGVAQAMPELCARIQAYAQRHAQHMEIIGDIIITPGGEACKNDVQQLWRLLDALAERRIDRHSYALAIGGGAVLDAVGLAASLFHRGVRHIRLPATVLAQADSGVGVKNAINWNGQKNLLGSFAPPWAVINDSCFIDSLPPREKRAGMAEAVKVALIRDALFFHWLEAQAAHLARFEPCAMSALIERSAHLHLHQITHGGDPFEHGSARPLDYGHWIAHKLERLSRHALSHGEAVALGLVLDARYAVQCGLLAAGEEVRIWRLLRQLGFSLWHAQLAACDAQGRLCLLQGLEEFREHLGGSLCITLLRGIGQACEVDQIDAQQVLHALHWLARQEGQDEQALPALNGVAERRLAS
ncbi:3-dehydroquinate synthase [Massilia sp. W12]|uniref:3-dehydroquinate synthase n=1 Tax=Massilia sp. W12 TaxID=3126507 RepID=UPI0030CEAF5C